MSVLRRSFATSSSISKSLRRIESIPAQPATHTHGWAKHEKFQCSTCKLRLGSGKIALKFEEPTTVSGIRSWASIFSCRLQFFCCYLPVAPLGDDCVLFWNKLSYSEIRIGRFWRKQHRNSWLRRKVIWSGGSLLCVWWLHCGIYFSSTVRCAGWSSP